MKPLDLGYFLEIENGQVAHHSVAENSEVNAFFRLGLQVTFDVEHKNRLVLRPFDRTEVTPFKS